MMQKDTVQISKIHIREWQVREIRQDLYQWLLPYDGFLGYMSGVLNLLRHRNNDLSELQDFLLIE